jgi:hypothetical protein
VILAGINNMQYRKTPWGRVLLEKLTDPQLIKKFLAFYATRRFVAAFTRARHVSLSWAWSIQSMPPHPISWRFILILSSHPSLSLPKEYYLTVASFDKHTHTHITFDIQCSRVFRIIHVSNFASQALVVYWLSPWNRKIKKKIERPPSCYFTFYKNITLGKVAYFAKFSYHTSFTRYKRRNWRSVWEARAFTMLLLRTVGNWKKEA